MNNKIFKKAVIIAAFLCLLCIYLQPKPIFEKSCEPKEIYCGEFYAKLDKNGRLTVYNETTGSLLFSSETENYVYDFILTDFTGDGSCDLLFALWKHGSFGNSRPFWHRKLELSDFKKSAHVYAYSLKGKKFCSIWCSSELKLPVESISVTDRYSNQNTLVIYMPVKKGMYENYAEYWYWSGWGFSGESQLKNREL
ncbi:MAG: hypothetical protein ACTTH0_02860 [Eubacteriales bacterium]